MPADLQFMPIDKCHWVCALLLIRHNDQLKWRRAKKEKCSSREFLGRAVYLVPVPKRPKELNAGRLRVGVRRTSNNRGKNMKNWAMLLACGMVAFAIGCGDGGGAKPAANPAADKAKMEEAMKTGMANAATAAAPGGEAAPADAGDKKDAPAEDKKDAPAEDKKDAPAEDKKDAPAEDKKE